MKDRNDLPFSPQELMAMDEELRLYAKDIEHLVNPPTYAEWNKMRQKK